MTLRAIAASATTYNRFLCMRSSDVPAYRLLNRGAAVLKSTVVRQMILNQASRFLITVTSYPWKKIFLQLDGSSSSRLYGFSATIPLMEKLIVKVPTMGDSITEVQYDRFLTDS
jgi:hypothetical protein